MSFSTTLVARLTILILVTIAVTSAFGQASVREISGRVVDANSHAVGGAHVILESLRPGDRRDATTGSDGAFVFKSVATGDYRVTVEAATFAVLHRDITAAQTGDLELVLGAAPIAAEISVSTNYLTGGESLNELPGSIERLDRTTLENSRVFNFNEALRKFAGVTVRDEEGFGLRPNIGIRGTNPTRSSKVLLLEDGVPLSFAPYGDNASYYHPPVERFESIEVLKGSGQIAYGPQTIAGVINYLTPNPPARPELNFKFEGGNNGFFNGSVGAGTTFGDLGLLVNYTHKRGDGTRVNTNFALNDLAVKSTYTFNDRHALTAKFSFFREDSNLTYTGATEAEYAADPRGNIFKNDFFYGRRYGFSLQHTAVATRAVNFTTNFYSNYFSRDWWRQTSNSGERPLRLFRPSDPTNPISDADCRSLADLSTTCGNRGNLRDYLTLGVEPRVNAVFDIGPLRNDLTAGFRVHREDQDRLGKYGDLPNSRDGILNEFNERKALAYSAFVQNRFIWKNIAVTPGLRVEKINYERTNFLTSGAPLTGRTSVTEIVPGLGIAYSGLRNTTIFAGVHRGFAPPRVEDVVNIAGAVVELDSELSWNYEAGVRSRPMRGVDLSAAIFRNDYENQIVASSIASGTQFTNGGRTMQQGMEFTAALSSGAILDSPHNFYLRTAMTFLPVAEFRGERFSSVTSSALLNTYCPPAARVAATRCSITGNRLPYAPETQVTTSIGYSHTRGIDAFVENVFIGRQFGDDLNAVNPTPNGQIGAIPAQTYWNATANYRIEKWKSTFFVTAKNIFDRTLIVDRSRGILPSNGRLVQAGVKVSF